MRNTEDQPWEDHTRLRAMEVCLKCFRLRGHYEDKEHRCRCIPRDDKWHETEWPHYDIAALIDICNLCARGTMKSGSRYTWLVCDQCRSVNTRIGQVFNASNQGALPVGRHSIMNRIALRGGDLDDAVIKEFSAWLFGLTRVWLRLSDWGHEEAKRLAESGDVHGKAVPLVSWLKRFPSSTGASVDAYCRYVEYDLPDHSLTRSLIAERNRFLERQPAPSQAPGDQNE
jgi:hypothetical protein